MGNFRPPKEIAPVGMAPPISSDPPFHHDARKLLLPAFSKTAISRYEQATREFCHSLIDGFAGRTWSTPRTSTRSTSRCGSSRRCSAFRTRTGTVPPLRRDGARGDQPAARGAHVADVEQLGLYIDAQIQDHIDSPRDDLTTYLLNAEIFGQKLSAEHVGGSIALLLIAGIDTTWSAIGASLWHLAKTPEDRRRLAADPALMPTAVEEFLRAYAPVTMARMVKDDMKWHGVDMKADDWVLLSFPSANRDPEQFERADEVVIDREVNRHAAFGLGIHRCVGSHLARMELRVALEVWMERVPEFSLADAAAVRWSAGQVRGPRGAAADHRLALTRRRGTRPAARAARARPARAGARGRPGSRTGGSPGSPPHGSPAGAAGRGRPA